MKKLISITAVSIALATSAHSSYSENWQFLLENKKEFCSTVTTKIYASKISVDKDVCKTDKFDSQSSIQAIYNATNNYFNQKVGTLSTEFLKKTGVGLKQTKSWGNIAVSYSKFLCTLSQKDKEQLTMFYMDSISTSKLFKDNKWQSSFMTVDSLRKYVKYINSKDFIRILINKDKKYNDKIFSKFFKYILFNDFQKAKDYMLKINKENMMTENNLTIKRLCKNNNLKTVEDMMFYEK